MRLRTLGGLRLEGTPFRRQKPLLLLAYLAMAGPTPRRRLVELFWADAADGRDSLHTALHRLRGVGPDLFLADGELLGVDVTCDAVDFEAAVRARDHEAALAHYGGAFLEDLDLGLSPELEEWLYTTRERLAVQARTALLDLAERAVRDRRWPQAREHAERAFHLPHGPAWSAEELERLVRLLDATESPLALADDRFRHGACFVPLEAAADHDAAVTALATALRLEASPSAPLDRQVLDAIGDRELLVVLDNFEHLVGVCPLPADVVRECPNARVVVTSRRRLNVAEEHVLRLEGLSATSETGEPEALQLLAERLERHAVGSRPLEGQVELGRRVCELLGGNPLGIELAAANARYMPLGDLARELAAGLDPLVSPDPTSGPRHQSMAASLRLSWDLLGERERDAFAALSVFRGGCDRQAAAEVAGADRATLEGLCDAALVRAQPLGRYDQHPLVHRFGAERLAERPGLEQAVQEAHARYYLERAGDLGHDVLSADTTREALDWLESELPNIERA